MSISTSISIFVAIILCLLYVAKDLLIPIAAAMLLSFLILPIARKLEKKLPRGFAILIAIFMMAIATAAILLFLSSQFISFFEELPMISSKINTRFLEIQHLISNRFNISEKRQLEWLEKQFTNAVSSGGELAGNIFSATGNFLATATLIPIYIFFFIYYRTRFAAFLKMLIPDNQHPQLLMILHKTASVSQKYLAGLLIDIAILSILNSIGFYFLGISHAIFLGVVAGMLNIIPYVGVLIGSVIPVALALITKDSIWIAVGALGVCVFVQFLDNNFITPIIVGSAVSINPLATTIVLIVGGMLWGLAGMMLFIPFLGILKVIFDHVDSLKPLGFLIGDDTGKNPMSSQKKTTDQSAIL